MKVPLQDWAEMHYSPAPSIWVLRRWVREGQIYPTPEKVGSSYYVQKDARRLTSSRPSLVDRLTSAA